jgi:hypothetical protein
MNAGFRPGGGGVNSICGASAWKCFGLPAMLYGCELCWNLTATENEMLNRTNAFAAKCIQGLPPTTNTVAAIGTLGYGPQVLILTEESYCFYGNGNGLLNNSLQNIYIRITSYLHD